MVVLPWTIQVLNVEIGNIEDNWALYLWRFLTEDKQYFAYLNSWPSILCNSSRESVCFKMFFYYETKDKISNILISTILNLSHILLFLHGMLRINASSHTEVIFFLIKSELWAWNMIYVVLINMSGITHVEC